MATNGPPDLQLPQRSTSSRSGGGGPKIGPVYFLLVLVLGIQAWIAFVDHAEPTVNPARENPAEAASERTLAMMLEDRNLPAAAVDAWERYITQAGPSGPEEGKIRYRIAKLKQNAERFEQALGEYYRAEQLLGDEAGDLSQKIAVRVRECLMKLGQYADLSREMSARAGGSPDSKSLEGRQVVAQIGEEKLTVADFDRMLTQQIEQLIAMQVGISDADADAIRRQAHARFADPKAEADQLQQFVASRVLAAEARKRGLGKTEAFRRQVADSMDRLLATNLMLDEVSRRATVTPQDVDRYYKANMSSYAEPARVSIAHILCDSEETARATIVRANDGDPFDELAREDSLDKTTASDGGVIPQEVVEGVPTIPQIGRMKDLYTAIMAAPAGTVLATPYKSERGWHVVKVIKRTEQRVKPFEEVHDAVERDVRSARRSEVSQQFLEELFKANSVRLYPTAFAPSKTRDNEGDTSSVN